MSLCLLLAECGRHDCGGGLVAACFSVHHHLISPKTLYHKWLSVSVQLCTKLDNIRTECACPY